MIIRNRRINTKSDVVQLSVSYSAVDVKCWLKYYASLYTRGTEMEKGQLITITQTENDIRSWLENDPRALANWETKWREQLSSWAWATAVRYGYLVQSATQGRENEYYLASYLFHKRGRPKKDE